MVDGGVQVIISVSFFICLCSVRSVLVGWYFVVVRLPLSFVHNQTLAVLYVFQKGPRNVSCVSVAQFTIASRKM